MEKAPEKRITFAKLVGMNTYTLGLSFMWNSLHPIVLPAVLLHLVPMETKNSYLGGLTFLGMLLAMFVQPISGAASDHWRSRWGRRRPLALLGTLLKIKPVLMVEDGLIVPLSSVRTKRKAIAFMLEQASRSVEGHHHVRLAVAHGQVPDEMDELLQMIHQRFGSCEVFTSEVGPVIGTHTGPGVLGMAVCPIQDGL